MNTVLLDRDGTVIAEPSDNRVDTVDKIELFPDTLEALTYLADNDFAVIFITNQAGISEGRLTPEEFEKINTEVTKKLESSGVEILKTYLCPHTPADNCPCGKPKPTMIRKAADDFDLDPAEIFMVGDRRSDILAGDSAGTKTVLVETSGDDVTAPEATHTHCT
jgi:D-glycero-D-manno-heptose 1,7-bisphosphate phosphatase